MADQDFYDLLGVSKDADDAALKSAYRKKAMQYHPDRNQGDADAEKKFKEVSQAYEILKDPQKRAAYDRFGAAAFEGGGPGGGAGGGFGGGGFADIFEEMFGDFMGAAAGRRRQGSGRGADMRFDLEISLEESFNGKKATLKVPTQTSCEACDGSGSEGGGEPEICGTCNGTGRIRAQQGFFTIERTCPTCNGAGRVIKNPCKVCHGSGRVQTERSLAVDIPPGVEEGTRIRLAGEGEAGLRGAPSGDLYIFLSIKPHRLFQRDGADVYCRVPLPMTTAALGGTVEVPTIDGGSAKITVNEGTQSGNRFRLRNKGMSILHSASRGDMYVEVQVEVPKRLDKRQRELLEEFQSLQGDNDKEAHPESQGWFARVREFFDAHGSEKD